MEVQSINTMHILEGTTGILRPHCSQCSADVQTEYTSAGPLVYKLTYRRRHLANNVLHMTVESADAARLTLDMLAETAERPELGAASVPKRWTFVDLVIMRGTREVLVEPAEGFERAVAQEALKLSPVE